MTGARYLNFGVRVHSSHLGQVLGLLETNAKANQHMTLAMGQMVTAALADHGFLLKSIEQQLHHIYSTVTIPSQNADNRIEEVCLMLAKKPLGPSALQAADSAFDAAEAVDGANSDTLAVTTQAPTSFSSSLQQASEYSGQCSWGCDCLATSPSSSQLWTLSRLSLVVSLGA